jgi:Transketolase, thiamine diphosphate binding domain
MSTQVESGTIDQLSINTIRTVAMDAVQAANSGHPGTPMALAPLVYCLWQRFLRYDPENPMWVNRDRFVLSVGHASMLLYSIVHLSGVKAVNAKYERLGELSVTLDDIKHFRSSRANVQAIQNIAGQRESRRPLARLVKVLLPVLAWLLPVTGWQRTSIALASICLITMSTHSPEMGA